MLNLNFDQSFYYTQVKHPVMLVKNTNNFEFYYYNSPSDLRAKGFDTNFHLSLDDFELYFEYTFIDARQVFSNYSNYLELTPKNKINITLNLQ